MSSNSDTPDDKPRRPRAMPVRADSTPPEPPDVDEEEQASPEPEPDPDSIRLRFRDPGVRNYLFAGLAALAMIFVILFGQGADIGGVILILLGSAGLVLRWTATPPLFLLVLTYFLIFPFGIPDRDSLYADRFLIEDSRSQLGYLIPHVMLAFSVVVYYICSYRMLGMTLQVVPSDTSVPKKSETKIRRPAELIVPGEIKKVLYLAGVVVFVGQFIWFLTTDLELDIGAIIPVKLAGTERTRSREMNPALTRLILLGGMLFFGMVLARLIFGYWQMRSMTAVEGGMILQDANWDETRRERVRVEKWRAWAMKRAAERAKKSASQQLEGTKQ